MFRFIFIYTLLIVAFIQDGLHAMVFMTIWNLCFQAVYFTCTKKAFETKALSISKTSVGHSHPFLLPIGAYQ